LKLVIKQTWTIYQSQKTSLRNSLAQITPTALFYLD